MYGLWFWGCDATWNILELNIPIILILGSSIGLASANHRYGVMWLGFCLVVGVLLVIYIARKYVSRYGTPIPGERQNNNICWNEVLLFRVGLIYFWPMIYVAKTLGNEERGNFLHQRHYWLQLVLSVCIFYVPINAFVSALGEREPFILPSPFHAVVRPVVIFLGIFLIGLVMVYPWKRVFEKQLGTREGKG